MTVVEVEEKPQQKKGKKGKKVQPKKVVEEDLDAIFKEMGVERSFVRIGSCVVQEDDKKVAAAPKADEVGVVMKSH